MAASLVVKDACLAVKFGALGFEGLSGNALKLFGCLEGFWGDGFVVLGSISLGIENVNRCGYLRRR